MLKELKETMSKELNTSVRMMSHQIENISKVTKCMKRKTNRKSKVEKYNNWNLKIIRGAQQSFEQAGKIISQLEDRSIDIIQSEEYNGSPRNEERKKGQKEYLKK